MSRRHSAGAFERAALVDVGFVVALAAVATFAAWPIYETWYLFVTAGGAVLLAGVIAVLALLLRWTWPTVALSVIVGFVAFGVPLAVPRALGSRLALAEGYRDLVVGAVFDWKRLVTVELPVGRYQTLLVPLLLTLLVCTTVALVLTLRQARASAVVVPVMLLPVAFAIAFGSSAVSAPFTVAGVQIAAPREVLVGVLALGLAGGYLVWREQHARTVALRALASASGVHRQGGTLPATLRRVVGAVAVAAVALLVAVPLSSTALEPSNREVLRTAIDPAAQLRQYPSPLTDYRASFTPAKFDQKLLTVSGDTAALGRLRLATMSFYDGQEFSVLSSDADRASAFAHIPQLTDPVSGSGLVTAQVTISGYDGVWLPTVAGLKAVGFHGTRTNALTDGFYYNKDAEAGVQLDTLRRGDSYTLVAEPQRSSRTLADLGAPSAPSTVAADNSTIPASLSAWVTEQGLGDDGASLAELISRLRARGYLSHSLEQSDATAWMKALGSSYQQFEPSLAGESMDRIDELFTELLDQQHAAGANAPADQLVAGVGDDEQFAVASALIAQSLGYPARVVLGFRLSGGGDQDIPACDDGTCRGQNLTAWVEVQDTDGTWVAADTTPQHTVPLSNTDQPRRVPNVGTQVQQRGARVQPPPEANPSGGDRHSDEHPNDAGPGPAQWLPVLRIGGSILLALMALAAPLASVLIVKAARRRQRRRAASTAARMAGGWEELVDTAVDLGLPAPGVRTRVEAATVYATAARSADAGRLRTLASGADEAVFGAFDPAPQTAEQYWAQLDEQRTRLAAGFPRWKRAWAWFSLRSFRTCRGGS